MQGEWKQLALHIVFWAMLAEYRSIDIESFNKMAPNFINNLETASYLPGHASFPNVSPLTGLITISN